PLATSAPTITAPSTVSAVSRRRRIVRRYAAARWEDIASRIFPAPRVGGSKGSGLPSERNSALMLECAHRHVDEPCTEQRLLPPFDSGRMLPAPGDHTARILQQPKQSGRSVTNQLLNNQCDHRPVTTIGEADAKHHVGEHQASVGTQYAHGLGQCATLI